MSTKYYICHIDTKLHTTISKTPTSNKMRKEEAYIKQQPYTESDYTDS